MMGTVCDVEQVGHVEQVRAVLIAKSHESGFATYGPSVVPITAW